ncbi:hypothetical protein CVT24_010140 [Panaeolus cyanescens]|uniref:Uncharacterized protein n=1 Tax=Panaeolus cyanescens TaxID=181874 RepID=A0A409X2U8_9AGAR|nr:hypothetical protein CVT24_010140 [Panaeolus cyanescens]
MEAFSKRRSHHDGSAGPADYKLHEPNIFDAECNRCNRLNTLLKVKQAEIDRLSNLSLRDFLLQRQPLNIERGTKKSEAIQSSLKVKSRRAQKAIRILLEEDVKKSDELVELVLAKNELETENRILADALDLLQEKVKELELLSLAGTRDQTHKSRQVDHSNDQNTNPF